MYESANPLVPASSREEDRTAEAIRQANAGDHDGLGYLYVRYARDVHTYVRRIVANHHDAEEVTQQVFLKLITRLCQYEPKQAHFSTWMLRVARNTAIDHLRQNRLVLLDEPFEPLLEARSSDPDCSMALREAFESLPQDQRRVLLLRDVIGLAPRDVATRLGTTPGAVNTCCHRARRSARRSLESRGWTPVTRLPEAARAV
jgi:RNA polymerase sigma-70 factor, ECF subfamily